MNNQVVIVTSVLILIIVAGVFIFVGNQVIQSVLSGEADATAVINIQADRCAGQEANLKCTGTTKCGVHNKGSNFACRYIWVVGRSERGVGNGQSIPIWNSGSHILSTQIVLDASRHQEKGVAVYTYSSPNGVVSFELKDGESRKINDAVLVTAHVSPGMITYARYDLLVKGEAYTFDKITFEGYQPGLDWLSIKTDITLDPDAVAKLNTTSFTDLNFLEDKAILPSVLESSLPGLEWGVLVKDASKAFFTSDTLYHVGITNGKVGTVVFAPTTFDVPVVSGELGKRDLMTTPVLVSRTFPGDLEQGSTYFTKTAFSQGSVVDIKPVVVGKVEIGEAVGRYGTSAGGLVSASAGGTARVEGAKVTFGSLDFKGEDLSTYAMITFIVLFMLFLASLAVYNKKN